MLGGQTVGLVLDEIELFFLEGKFDEAPCGSPLHHEISRGGRESQQLEDLRCGRATIIVDHVRVLGGAAGDPSGRGGGAGVMAGLLMNNLVVR